MSRQGEAQERNLGNVRDFWNKEAVEWGESPQVTIRDHYFRLLEMDRVCDRIAGRSHVLDIGCGTGFSTLFYSEKVDQIVGADYAEKMVVTAERFLRDPVYLEQTMGQYAPDGPPRLRGNVRFEQGDILRIGYPLATFDAVVTERVLINLPQQELQDEAVHEVARVLQPGGLWVAVEVTRQGHQIVDNLRTMFGLPVIEKYWHNLYVEEDHFVTSAQLANLVLEDTLYFETYQFLSKVVHPRVVAPKEPKFLAGFNNAARKIAREYPTYRSVAALGLERFLKEKFRPLLQQLDAEKVDAYDRVVQEVVNVNPDFTRCSHQVLFVFKKRGG